MSLRIKEINSDQEFNTARQNENGGDYLYLLKHKYTIVMSDNGTLKPMTDFQYCATLQEYTSINPKLNIVYLVKISSGFYRLYFNSYLIYDGEDIEYRITDLEYSLGDIADILDYINGEEIQVISAGGGGMIEEDGEF